jgi:c(7)-type cytochrome triheme protein
VKRQRSLILLLVLLGAATAGIAAGPWRPLVHDGLHDPASPAIGVLQEPAEALGVLQSDTAGNMVDWVGSVDQGIIAPRPSLHDDREPEILDSTVLMRNTNELGYVLFPHKPHTQWMSCEACHDSIFIAEVDANPINMGKILNGEYCGLCHGAVSFPLTECNRCHSVNPADVRADGSIGGQGDKPQ